MFDSRQVVAWHRPYCVDLEESTFSHLRSFLEHYCDKINSEIPPLPFPSSRYVQHMRVTDFYIFFSTAVVCGLVLVSLFFNKRTSDLFACSGAIYFLYNTGTFYTLNVAIFFLEFIVIMHCIKYYSSELSFKTHFSV